MNPTSSQDPRTTDLLSRVSQDVSLLRQDIGQLLSHAAHHTLPSSARELADSARTRLASGKLYTAEQLRALRNQIQQPATAWIGGAVVVGLIAAGIYLFCKGDDSTAGFEPEDEDE
jgi:hypothetical protein